MHKTFIVLSTVGLLAAVSMSPGLAQSQRNSPEGVNSGKSDPAAPTYLNSRQKNDSANRGDNSGEGNGGTSGSGATGADGGTSDSGAAGGAAGGAGTGGAAGAGGAGAGGAGAGGGSQ